MEVVHSLGVVGGPQLLFVDDVDQVVLHWIYAGVGLFVLAGIILVPPRRRAQPPRKAA